MEKSFKESLKEVRGIETDDHYYANSYLSNIYPPQMAEKHIRMFCKGEGQELLPKDGKKEKGACIYSSSMLAYNFFSWIDEDHPLEFENVKYNKVVFEEQFRVLKNKNNRANLDVVLVSEDENTILLIESKFTEHFKCGTVDISNAYDTKESYFVNGDKWTEVIKAIRDSMDNNKEEYYGGIKQVACHLIGISGVIQDENLRGWFNNNSWLHHIEGISLKGDETFIFKSLVFHPKEGYEKERSRQYEELNRKLISNIASQQILPPNLKVKNPIITYRDLWNNGLYNSLTDNKLEDFLKRYLEVHV